MGTWHVKVHSLYLGDRVFEVDAENDVDAVVEAKRAWFKLFKGVRGAVWSAEVVQDEA